MEVVENDLTKRYTYAEYYSWDDGKRWELINGFLFELPSGETTKHQKVLGNILCLLLPSPSKEKWHVYPAPFDVRFPSKKGEKSDDKIYNVVQPDICIICDVSKLDERGCIGAPDLIVEILSLSTVKKDIEDKYRLYEENGVKEYWIVQPNDETLTVFMLEKGKYQHKGIYTRGSKVKVGIFEGTMAIDLDLVFRD